MGSNYKVLVKMLNNCSFHNFRDKQVNMGSNYKVLVMELNSCSFHNFMDKQVNMGSNYKVLVKELNIDFHKSRDIQFNMEWIHN